jgi:uncharacterized YigZ family protein
MTNTRGTYFSIRRPSEGLYKEKGSKFIALAFPVHTEEDIALQLEETRKQYHDARHHCYAWRLGAEGEAYRYNDDGEPSGSAGKPIHGQLLSLGMSDVLVIVVRYFGGTKLGVGGLVNAYRTAARDALEKADTLLKAQRACFSFHFPYPKMNEVMRFLRENELEIEDTDFQMDCRIRAHTSLERADKLEAAAEDFFGVECKREEDKVYSLK